MFRKILQYIMLVALVTVLVFFIIELNSQRVISILENLLKKPSLNTQNFNLRLNYLLVIPVGQARIDILGKEKFRSEDLIHIRAEAATFDFIKKLFYAQATIDSYINPIELDSVYFLQHLEMTNKPDEDKEISYDQKKHIMTYKGRRGTEERIIGERSQDPLSAIYYIQNKELNVGEELKLNLNTNQKNYIITTKCIDSQTISIKNNIYKVWIIVGDAARKDKSPRHKSSFKIWLLDNNGVKMPILIKAMTNIGPIVAKAQ